MASNKYHIVKPDSDREAFWPIVFCGIQRKQAYQGKQGYGSIGVTELPWRLDRAPQTVCKMCLRLWRAKQPLSETWHIGLVVIPDSIPAPLIAKITAEVLALETERAAAEKQNEEWLKADSKANAALIQENELLTDRAEAAERDTKDAESNRDASEGMVADLKFKLEQAEKRARDAEGDRDRKAEIIANNIIGMSGRDVEIARLRDELAAAKAEIAGLSRKNELLITTIESTPDRDELAAAKRYKGALGMITMAFAPDDMVINVGNPLENAETICEHITGKLRYRARAIPVSERLPTINDAENAPLDWYDVEWWNSALIRWERHHYWQWTNVPDRYTHWRKIDNTPPEPEKV